MLKRPQTKDLATPGVRLAQNRADKEMARLKKSAAFLASTPAARTFQAFSPATRIGPSTLARDGILVDATSQEEAIAMLPPGWYIAWEL